jgi:riboflavin biosynthesis pyrimidine reductase
MQRPYVHINVAMTADGKIDTFNHFISAVKRTRGQVAR